MLSDVVSAIINFLTYPIWHLVAMYVIIFLAVAYSMVKSWGF